MARGIRMNVHSLTSVGFLASFVVRRSRRRPHPDEEGQEGYLFVQEQRDEG